MEEQKTLTNVELKNVNRFWNYIEKETGIKNPVPEKDWKNMKTTIPLMESLCGDHPFDPEYAAKQFLVLRKSW